MKRHGLNCSELELLNKLLGDILTTLSDDVALSAQIASAVQDVAASVKAVEDKLAALVAAGSGADAAQVQDIFDSLDAAKTGLASIKAGAAAAVAPPAEPAA